MFEDKVRVSIMDYDLLHPGVMSGDVVCSAGMLNDANVVTIGKLDAAKLGAGISGCSC